MEIVLNNTLPSYTNFTVLKLVNNPGPSQSRSQKWATAFNLFVFYGDFVVCLLLFVCCVYNTVSCFLRIMN